MAVAMIYPEGKRGGAKGHGANPKNLGLSDANIFVKPAPWSRMRHVFLTRPELNSHPCTICHLSTPRDLKSNKSERSDCK
jgi:hypothetical protein